MKLLNWLRGRTRIRQFIRNVNMQYVHRRIGLHDVDITFFINTPYRYISNDLKAGPYGSIGSRAYICPNVILGNYVLIAPDLLILGGDHTYNIPGKPIIFQRRPSVPLTIIEDDVWIGCRVTIMAGVHIERGAIIAAGSVVTRNVPSYTIVGGVPAKIIKKRFANYADIEKHDAMLKLVPKAHGNYVLQKKILNR